MINLNFWSENIFLKMMSWTNHFGSYSETRVYKKSFGHHQNVWHWHCPYYHIEEHSNAVGSMAKSKLFSIFKQQLIIQIVIECLFLELFQLPFDMIAVSLFSPNCIPHHVCGFNVLFDFNECWLICFSHVCGCVYFNLREKHEIYALFLNKKKKDTLQNK